MKYLLVALLLIPLISYSQNPFNAPLDAKTGRITFVDSVTLSKSSETIYKAVKAFVNNGIINGDYSLVLDDKDLSMIAFKGSFDIIDSGTINILERVSYTVSVNAGNNPVKLVVTNFNCTLDIEKHSKVYVFDKTFFFDPASEEGKKYYEVRKNRYEKFNKIILGIISELKQVFH